MADTSAALKTRIADILNGTNLQYLANENGGWEVEHGSTIVFIDCKESDGWTWVIFKAPVAIDCKSISPEVMQFMLEQNNKMAGAAFSLNSNDSRISINSSLLGDTLDREELIMGLSNVVAAADHFDEQITSATGGLRWADLKTE